MFKNIGNELKEFILRGNVLDMAVGIIIGASFGKIVDSLVKDIIMPPIGLILGKVDFLKSLSEYLSGCSSEVERDSYIISLSSILGVSDETIKEDLNKARTTVRSVEGGNEEAVQNNSASGCVLLQLQYTCRRYA